MRPVELSPLLLVALFDEQYGDQAVHPLDDNGFVPETPNKELWIGHHLNLNPERSTAAWIGRSDRIASLWPYMLQIASAGGLLTDTVVEDWDYKSPRQPLTKLVNEFLIPQIAAPAMLIVHQVCWRNEPYERLHTSATMEPAQKTRYRWYAYGESVRLRRLSNDPNAILLSPHMVLRWHAPSGLSERQLGFVKRTTFTDIVRDGRTVGHNFSERLAIGKPNTSDCRFWHRAKIPVACAGLAYGLTLAPGDSLMLEPFDHESFVLKPFLRPAILDVQLIKFARLVPRCDPPDPFDVERQELILAFERLAGRLVYVSLSSYTLSDTYGDLTHSDWGKWLVSRPQLLSRAMDSFRRIF